jgi:hypothetical protein
MVTLAEVEEVAIVGIVVVMEMAAAVLRDREMLVVLV